MNKLRIILASIITVFALAPVLTPSFATAQSPKDEICKGIGIAGGGTSNCDPGTGPKVDDAVSGAINLLSIAVGVIAVIMVIIGGLKYIMSSGDSNNINSAKNTILYAIIGLVVVAFAQIIVKFVLNKV